MKANIDAGIVVPSQKYESQGVHYDVVAPAPQQMQVRLEMVPEEEQHKKGLFSPIHIPSSITTQGQEEDQMEVGKTAGRKRSCEALDYVDEIGPTKEDAGAVRETTPPKRQRTEDSHSDLTVYTPIRLEKRRSEELGDTEENVKYGLSTETVQHKKARTDSSLSSAPVSPTLDVGAI